MAKSPSFQKCDGGGVAVMSAFGAIAVIGVASMAITFSDVSKQHAMVQGALDAAVLAGTALPYDASPKDRVYIALKVFDHNAEGSANMAVGADDREFTAGAAIKPTFTVNGSRVAGVATAKVSNAFGSILGLQPVEVRITGQAERMDSDPVCVLTLDENSPNGLEVYGNAQFNAKNCAVQANSSDSGGMRTYGSGKASASQFGVTGNFRGNSFDPAPMIGIERVKDPYAQLPVPEVQPCVDVSSRLAKAEFTLQPGTYCGGLNIKAGAMVTMEPGVYIMKDGQLSVNSGATLVGQEVMVAYVGANSYLHMLSGSTVTLSSPRSGTYKNIQMMSDRVLSQSKFGEEWATVLSGAKLEYDGVIYLPEQQLWVSGAGHDTVIKGSSPTMILIADKVWAQGNAIFDLTREDKRGVGQDGGLVSFSYGSRLFK